MTTSSVAVVMVPLPAQGHLNQLLHLSRLISARNIPVYYVGAATHVRQAKLRLHGWDPSSAPNLNFHEFPTVPFDNPPPDPNAPHKFPSQIVPSLLASASLRKPVCTFADELSRVFGRVVVIYDLLMSYVVQDIENAECYIFRSISGFSACAWDAESWPDLPHGAEIIREIPSVDGYYSEKFSEFLDLQYCAKKVSCGEIYNSNREIEGLFLDLLEKKLENGGGKLWAIGPFSPTRIPAKNHHRCLDWLDKQEPDSVVFVSFGTTSSLTDEQIGNIAIGLEGSEQKFVWVLRDADKGDIFTGEVRETQLPDGFEERVRERGIVVRDWAPQLEILGHRSTGGFMTHCGWNSCMESIAMGVPVAAWPLHSDQPGNAVLMTRVLGIGVSVKSWGREEEELVEGRSVEEVVRKLMGTEEGAEMRRRAAEIGRAVRSSVVEGGTAWKEFESFINYITR